jgi:hypothetical protein
MLLAGLQPRSDNVVSVVSATGLACRVTGTALSSLQLAAAYYGTTGQRYQVARKLRFKVSPLCVLQALHIFSASHSVLLIESLT